MGRELGGPEDLVSGTLEVAAKEIGGGKLLQIAANGIRNHIQARGHVCKGGHTVVCRALLLEWG